MPSQITKADANPILIFICNWFILGCLGYFLLGQKQKAIAALIYTIVLSIIGIGALIPIICAIDGYQVATKLAAGETLASDYCALEFLSSLPLWKEN
jgi:hypothetical protein